MPEALLPSSRMPGRPRVWPWRKLIDGIRLQVRTGNPWRDVPAEYGPWGRVHDLFRRWQRDGTRHRTLSPLQSRADSQGSIAWDLNVDSTVCRAHQHAAGARNGASCRRSHPVASSSSRMTVGRGQKPISIVVTAGQRSDSPQFKTVLERVRVPRPGPGGPRIRPRRGRADQAYASHGSRAYLRRRGNHCTIPGKVTRPTIALFRCLRPPARPGPVRRGCCVLARVSGWVWGRWGVRFR
ncbi:IS5 family transposase [Streptomyces syringium]|uniref:IS5 family transposase n=1 Tax=Streptomyces syringium TaxID=76729 RepID=UPI0033AA95B6